MSAASHLKDGSSPVEVWPDGRFPVRAARPTTWRGCPRRTE